MRYLIVYKFKPEVDLNEFFATTAKKESAASWALYKTGLFQELYICTHAPVAMVMMEVPDRNQAERTAWSLPAFQQGLLDCELIPIGPFVNFAILFDKNKE